jgi:uncharacterized coiled-coil protein SlyX
MQTWVYMEIGNSLSVDDRFRRATGVREGRSLSKGLLTPPLAVDLARRIFFTSLKGVKRPRRLADNVKVSSRRETGMISLTLSLPVVATVEVTVMDDEILTLSAASKIGKVALGTMRGYAKQIPGAVQLPSREWQIPKPALLLFLAEREQAKKGRSVGGAVASGGNAPSNTVSRVEALLESRIELLEAELEKRDRTIDQLNRTIEQQTMDVRSAQGEVRKLEAEIRAHLSQKDSDSLVGSVSRWIKSKSK